MNDAISLIETEIAEYREIIRFSEQDIECQKNYIDANKQAIEFAQEKITFLERQIKLLEGPDL